MEFFTVKPYRITHKTSSHTTLEPKLDVDTLLTRTNKMSH